MIILLWNKINNKYFRYIILISTLFGNFPVPLMGYGISPIVGYFISITWLIKSYRVIK